MKKYVIRYTIEKTIEVEAFSSGRAVENWVNGLYTKTKSKALKGAEKFLAIYDVSNK